VRFREALWLRRGQVGRILAVLGVVLVAVGVVGYATGAPLLLLVSLPGAVAVTFAMTVHVETIVDDGTFSTTWRPWRAHRPIAISDVVDHDVTVLDQQVALFGGWAGSRGGLYGAVVESMEGPRQVGNRAVVLTLADGRTVTVRTWQPRRLLRALGRDDQSKPSNAEE